MSARLYSFMEALGKKPFPHLFHLLEVICIPWLVAPSFIFSNSRLSPSLPHSDILCCFPLPLFRTFIIMLGPLGWSKVISSSYSQLISNLHSLWSINSPVPYLAQVLGIRTWTCLGGHYSAYQTTSPTSEWSSSSLTWYYVQWPRAQTLRCGFLGSNLSSDSC